MKASGVEHKRGSIKICQANEKTGIQGHTQYLVILSTKVENLIGPAYPSKFNSLRETKCGSEIRMKVERAAELRISHGSDQS